MAQEKCNASVSAAATQIAGDASVYIGLDQGSAGGHKPMTGGVANCQMITIM